MIVLSLRASGSGADNLTFTWSATGGRLLSTTGREVSLDTTGITGSVTVTVRVNTDLTRCGEPCPGGRCSTTITVHEMPRPPPPPDIIKPCGPIFFPFNSARINNEHKACLDDIAIALQQDSRTTLVIDGHRDSSERVGISLTRANNARDYFVDAKKIDSARITIRNFSDVCPYDRRDSRLNSRVEFWIIPEGASIADIDKVKKCANGITPRPVTNEQPATEQRPARRTRRPEPSADLEEQEDEPDGADERVVNTNNSASQARQEAKNEASFGAATVVRSVSARVIGGALHVYVDTDGIARVQRLHAHESVAHRH